MVIIVKIERYGLECVENKFLKLPNVQKYELLKRTNCFCFGKQTETAEKGYGD